MNTSPEEYQLALRARDGDQDALAALVERVRVRLFALAYAELRHYEDAQDVTAEALLRICRNVGSLRQPERVGAWMQRIVRNEANRLRQERASGRQNAYQDGTEPPAAHGRFSALRLDIERALRRLPEDQARALALFHLAGISIREIARRVGRPEGTVKHWLHQGRRRLAQEMKGYAPMTTEWTAAILSTNMESDMVEQLTEAMRAAGWNKVNAINDYVSIARLEETGEGAAKEYHLKEYHLPEPLQGTQFIVLDDWIGGHSAFELLPLLRAAKTERLAIALLFTGAEPPDERCTVMSAWISGIDLCLRKPVNLDEFRRFTEQVRLSLMPQEEKG